ncbi:MAG: hypothetical protein MRY74_11040 [Neomegalonema sp.]|nr:hypothetical protein [Neomegalonema sp.]
MLDDADAKGPISGEVRVDRATYRDLSRAIWSQRRGRGWRIAREILVVILLWGVVIAAAYWASTETSWAYKGSDRYVKAVFIDGDAFRPAFFYGWGLVIIAYLALRFNWMLAALGAQRSARVRGASLNGAQVQIDRDGVSISGPDFGSRYGWTRIEAVYFGRTSMVLVIGAGGAPVPYASMDRPRARAAEQITAWRRAVREKGLGG